MGLLWKNYNEWMPIQTAVISRCLVSARNLAPPVVNLEEFPKKMDAGCF